MEFNKKYNVKIKNVAQCVAEEIKRGIENQNYTLKGILLAMHQELENNSPYFLPSSWYGNTVELKITELDGDTWRAHEEGVASFYIPIDFIESIDEV